MKPKPTLADLGLDSPVQPASKKSIQDIANEVDSDDLRNVIHCRNCNKLIHKESATCAYCKKPVIHPRANENNPPHTATATQVCRYCRSSISSAAIKCPQCREWVKKPEGFVSKAAGYSLLLAILLCSGIVVLSPRSDPTTNSRITDINGAILIQERDWPGCSTKELMNRLISYIVAKDESAFEQLMTIGEISGECTVFKQGEKVFLVEGEVFTGLAKVRRAGDIAEYWVQAEAIR
jgi:hypothetical protein